MPQLDKLTFASQIFWLFSAFFTLYLVSIKWILPTVATLLKVRQKYFGLLLNKADSSSEERIILEKDKNTFFGQSIGESISYFKILDNAANNWYLSSDKQLPWKKELIDTSNYIYTISMVEKTLIK